MKAVRWFGVVMVFLISMACGDDNPPVTSQSEGGHVMMSGGGEADVAATASSSSHPTPTYQKSTRFDEHGQVRGVYGVPYIPKQGN